MNVETGNEAAQFHFREYINQILLAVHMTRESMQVAEYPCILLTDPLLPSTRPLLPSSQSPSGVILTILLVLAYVGLF